jgi:hypothetical protein
MTDEEILNIYGITLNSRIVSFDEGMEYSKEFGTANGPLYFALDDWGVSEIDDTLLPVINSVLSDHDLEETTGSEMVWIELDHLLTKMWFHGHHDENKPDFSMPTDHFKRVVLLWKQFLLQPPLNGTKVSYNERVVLKWKLFLKRWRQFLRMH